jgi:hypothetical protein
MNHKPTFRDAEKISAYLDGQLSEAEARRVAARLESDPQLAEVAQKLRQARALLRQTPRRRVPRNFLLTPKIAGLKPPVPRAVPVFSWASAVTLLLFLFTLGGNLLGSLNYGAAAPERLLVAAPPSNIGGSPEGESPELAGPTLQNTPTAEAEAYALVGPSESADVSAQALPAEQTQPEPPVNPWLIVWPALSALSLGIAGFSRWLSWRKFKKQLSKL